MTDVAVRLVGRVYANWGRWVVDCPDPECWQALTVRWEDRAAPLVCPFCGLSYGVEWPDQDMVAGVLRLLLMRPDFTTRNWLPGETLEDLAVENAAHGIFGRMLPLDGGPAGETALQLTPGRIVVDELPAVPRRLVTDLDRLRALEKG